MEKEITAAAGRWRLTEVSRLSGSRGKSIYQAVSPEYGDVILKWNSDGSELRREAETLFRLVSGELGYPEEQLRRLLFLETVLANVWRLEDGEQPNLRELELAMELQ